MVYELVTPSDPITFLAPDDKIALVCAVLLGNGNAGCTREDGVDVQSMWMFHPNPMPEIEKILGEPMGDFIENQRKSIAECFQSFAYGSFSDRKQYDAAISAITDPGKLKQFKETHEDTQRTSMSKWVKAAWEMGENILEAAKTVNK